MPNDDLADLLGRVLRQMTDPGEAPVRGRGRPPVVQPPVGQRPAGQQPAGQQPAGQQPGGRPMRRRDVLDAEVVDAVSASGDEVARHVAQHMDTRQVGEHASHLGGAVAQELDAMQAHQRQLFGAGPRGSLAASSSNATAGGSGAAEGTSRGSGEAEKSAAQGIAALLRSKETLRSAFILGEILKRPSW